MMFHLGYLVQTFQVYKTSTLFWEIQPCSFFSSSPGPEKNISGFQGTKIQSLGCFPMKHHSDLDVK